MGKRLKSPMIVVLVLLLAVNVALSEELTLSYSDFPIPVIHKKKAVLCRGITYAELLDSKLKQNNLILAGEPFNITAGGVFFIDNSTMNKSKYYMKVQKRSGESGWVNIDKICLSLSPEDIGAINARRNFAVEYRNSLLQQGLDISVSVEGALSTKLTLYYALFNRAWAHQLSTNLKFMSKIQEYGFREVELCDVSNKKWTIQSYGNVRE